LPNSTEQKAKLSVGCDSPRSPHDDLPSLGLRGTDRHRDGPSPHCMGCRSSPNRTVECDWERRRSKNGTMRGNLDLDAMALFVRIVEEGSLSAAGRMLRLPKATVSRRLAQLEAAAGTPLLARSTRALSMTDAGRRFFERVQPIVHDAEAARSEIRTANTEPSGTLRLTAPIIFGEVVVAPGLVQFLQRYPRIQADLHFSDERVNIVAAGFD